MLKRGWMPIIAEHTMSYRRPLGVFKRFNATMELTHWDEKHFFMSHRFTMNGKVIAEGASKGVVRSKAGVSSQPSLQRAVQQDHDRSNRCNPAHCSAARAATTLRRDAERRATRQAPLPCVQKRPAPSPSAVDAVGRQGEWAGDCPPTPASGVAPRPTRVHP
jgi:uncharacterized membrane protein